MNQIKKFVFKELQGEKLDNSKLNYFLGGYDLSPVEITCTQWPEPGQCWKYLYFFIGIGV